MDYRLALMTGSEIPIQECQLTLHQPTIEEIGYIGETEFFTGVQTTTLYKSMFTQGENDLLDISNFQLFMTIMREKEAADKKKNVLSLFTLLFPQHKVLFTPQSLIFQKDGENSLIDENNFEIFQDVLRQVFCAKTGPMDQQAFNPKGKKAKEIADKLMRGRERVAQAKNSSTGSAFAMYISIISIGLKMSPNEVKKFTMFQIYDIIERYSLWVNWDIDVRVRLAGGKPDSQPDNWMKNLH